MICLKCDCEEFVLKNDAEVEQEFREETVKVRSPVLACKNCGWQALGPGQADELRRRTADAYRERHGLLTSLQIREIRAGLKMSQRQFADFLRVGEASVKRWETWLVQDASSDELIRVKCELEKRNQEQEKKRSQIDLWAHKLAELLACSSGSYALTTTISDARCGIQSTTDIWSQWNQSPVQLYLQCADFDLEGLPTIESFSLNPDRSQPSTAVGPVRELFEECQSAQTYICGLSPPFLRNANKGTFFFASCSAKSRRRKRKCPANQNLFLFRRYN